MVSVSASEHRTATAIDGFPERLLKAQEKLGAIPLDYEPTNVLSALKTGQTHVHRYLKPLLRRIEKGEIDPTWVITYRMPLAYAPRAYRMFRDERDECVEVVLNPWAGSDAAGGRPHAAH